MKALLIAFVWLIAANCAGHAQDQREALVDRLLTQSEMRAMSQTYMSAYAREFFQSWKANLLPLDAATEEVLLKEFTRRLTGEDLVFLPKLRAIYLRIFDQSELQAMVDFYESPVGRSISLKSKLLDEEVALIYYPGINDRAIKHWNDTVQALRAAGNKL